MESDVKKLNRLIQSEEEVQKYLHQKIKKLILDFRHLCHIDTH